MKQDESSRSSGSDNAWPFEIRAALPSDEEDVLRLATHLNSVNLPADRVAIRRLLELSEASFSETCHPKEQRRFTFVLRDLLSNRLVATSTLVAQLGRRDAPYVYFSVSKEEKYSRDLNLHFDHRTLQIGFSYDGPTELAGLIVDPSYRRHPGKLGLSISYIRFLFVAARRELFQKQLLAELLPPLEPDGTSHLWNALGRRFTGMTYREADRLSHENKDFIRDLFPSGIVYASLLNEAAQAVIGEVGYQTRGVEKMLRRVGFRYAERIDPFDGGPHFTANTDDVTVIQRFVRGPAAVVTSEGAPGRLVARLSAVLPYCRAVVAPAIVGEAVGVDASTIERLEASPGDSLSTVPIP